MKKFAITLFAAATLAAPVSIAWAGNPTAKDFKDQSDRIDYVYTAGPSKTASSVLVVCLTPASST